MSFGAALFFEMQLGSWVELLEAKAERRWAAVELLIDGLEALNMMAVSVASALVTLFLCVRLFSLLPHCTSASASSSLHSPRPIARLSEMPLRVTGFGRGPMCGGSWRPTRT